MEILKTVNEIDKKLHKSRNQRAKAILDKAMKKEGLTSIADVNDDGGVYISLSRKDYDLIMQPKYQEVRVKNNKAGVDKIKAEYDVLKENAIYVNLPSDIKDYPGFNCMDGGHTITANYELNRPRVKIRIISIPIGLEADIFASQDTCKTNLKFDVKYHAWLTINNDEDENVKAAKMVHNALIKWKISEDLPNFSKSGPFEVVKGKSAKKVAVNAEDRLNFCCEVLKKSNFYTSENGLRCNMWTALSRIYNAYMKGFFDSASLDDVKGALIASLKNQSIGSLTSGAVAELGFNALGAKYANAGGDYRKLLDIYLEYKICKYLGIDFVNP